MTTTLHFPDAILTIDTHDGEVLFAVLGAGPLVETTPEEFVVTCVSNRFADVELFLTPDEALQLCAALMGAVMAATKKTETT
jgi:hypothetical protein